MPTQPAHALSQEQSQELPQELIRIKRDGGALSAEAIHALVAGITDNSLSDAQVGALAMAIFLRGMSTAETVALTEAIRDSGQRLEWHTLDLPGPVLDKHSTGGVGDLVSLVLGPWVAACGGFVPMISGRGLGHTGGTLDKLEAIPGYSTAPSTARFRRLVKATGVAIIGQTDELAPADKRLYGVRDVTATVESLPLIVSSILGKKLACGLDALVMDVKVGNGAFMPSAEASHELAATIADVASQAGTPTTALITDMSQPLARSAGNALEVRVAIDMLTGRSSGKSTGSRLWQITRALSAELLLLGKLADHHEDALAQLDRALESGAAAERFAAMVAGLGGPADLLERPGAHLPRAAVQKIVHAERPGQLSAINTRALGLAVVQLGGGRTTPGAAIDPSVGLAGIAELGDIVEAGEPLAVVHAASDDDAELAARRVRDAMALSENTTATAPLIHQTIRRQAR